MICFRQHKHHTGSVSSVQQIKVLILSKKLRAAYSTPKCGVAVAQPHFVCKMPAPESAGR